MSTEKQTVREIMLPLSSFPCLKESGTVRDAIQQLRSFCPINGLGPCGFNELLVVNDQGGLVGRVTQQGILRVLFSTLLEAVDIKRFEGRKSEYSDLSTLLEDVMLKEGASHLQASVTRVIEKDIRVLPASTDLTHAMAVMVIGKETVLPVKDNGRLCGVVKLAEIFGALGDKLISMNNK